MISSTLVTILLASNILAANGCAGGLGGVGGGLLTNPSFRLKFHPPTSWTYPEANALADLSYFPGQSLTQTDATLRAKGDIEGAVMAAMNSLQLPTTGLSVEATYSPSQISDCRKAEGVTALATGSTFGYEEGGAITKLITVGATPIDQTECTNRKYLALTSTAAVTQAEYPPVEATVKIDGVTISEYQATLIAAKMSSNLQLNAKVDFTEEIMVS